MTKSTFIIIFCCLTCLVFAQNKEKRLAEIMQTYHNYNMFDGAVLVAEQGKVIYKSAFGMANREWNISNTTDTKFMIGSISKPLTAILTLIQVQKGLINLDKTLADYIPEFKGKPAGIVTVKQMLNHTSGIPNYDIINDFFPRISRQYFERQDYIKVYMDSTLAFEPGSRYMYSSWGYYTLGYLLERVTGKSYAQLMKAEIFDKIGMSSSGSYYHKQIVSKRATGYEYSLGGYETGDFRDQSNTMGTGDIYSTVEDLFKLHMALSNNTLLNKKLTDEMFTPGIRPASYGYGWFNQVFRITPKDSVATNYHLGSTEGFMSFFRRVPSTNSMVVILSNSKPIDFFNITNNLLKVLYNQPVVQKQPVHKVVESIIGKHGAAQAIAEYPKMKADTAHYYIDWVAMYYLTEYLLTTKRLDDARIISENNVKEFPNTDLIQLLMGNIYLELKREKDAIEYFKKALAITPQLEEAKNRLRELGVR